MNILVWQENNPDIKGGAESWIEYLAAGLKGRGHCVAWLWSEQIQQAVEEFVPDFVILGTLHNFVGLQYADWLADRGIPAVWMLHDYWPFCGPRMLMQDNNRSDARCEANDGVCQNSCGGRHPVPAVLGRFYTVTGNKYAADIMRRNGVRVDGVVEEGIDTSLFFPGPKQRLSIAASCAWSAPWKGMHVLQEALS